PPAPPPSGFGELLSWLPTTGLTNWVRFMVAAEAGLAVATSIAVTGSTAAANAMSARRARWAPVESRDMGADSFLRREGSRSAGDAEPDNVDIHVCRHTDRHGDGYVSSRGGLSGVPWYPFGQRCQV